MLLLDPPRTPYDLNWRMLGTEVRVHPMFWLIGAIMGMNALDLGFEYLLAWIVCFFVSILVHEFGHIWMGQVFGSHGHILLYGFGGLAVGSNHLVSPWRRIAVAFAGPLAGFLLVGVLFAMLAVLDPVRFEVYLALAQFELGFDAFGWTIPRDVWPNVVAMFRRPTVADFTLHTLIWINILWGLLNLLPIWPLDGGQISRDLFKLSSPSNGLRLSLGLSLVVAGLLSLHSIMAMYAKPLIPFLRIGSSWSAILFGVLAVQSFLLLQQTQRRDREYGDWDRDPEIWGR